MGDVNFLRKDLLLKKDFSLSSHLKHLNLGNGKILRPPHEQDPFQDISVDISTIRSFDDVFAVMLDRACSGFLQLEPMLFVWDQGFCFGKTWLFHSHYHNIAPVHLS